MVRQHATKNAIDYLEILDTLSPDESLRQYVLLVHCVKQISGITAANVRIEGGVRSQVNVVRASVATDLPESLKILSANLSEILDRDEAKNVLIVETDSAGDFSLYRLKLVQSTTSDYPPENFDPLLSQIEFSFKVECPSDFDCLTKLVCPPQTLSEPHINYLAKDYASFRSLLLDRLSTIMPDWEERNTADVGVALIEAFAYVGDYLSYYQDAVATEAYLGTARKRVSVHRHARLIDYPMHEGCNARAWVQVQCEGNDIYVVKGTQLFTKLTNNQVHISPNSSDYDKAMAQQPEVFETMHDVIICTAHNEIEFYTWGDEECCLPQGATRATLLDNDVDRLRLRTGDVLIFEEDRDPESGVANEKNPNHRHAVRLTRVYPEAELIRDGDPEPRLELKKDENGIYQSRADPLTGIPIVEIEWAVEDALPFSLCLQQVVDPNESGKGKQPVTVVSGNIILADHGRTIGEGKAGVYDIPETLLEPNEGRYRPWLKETQITHNVGYDDAKARQPASKAMEQDPREALAAVTLQDGDGNLWLAQHDLLDSSEFDHDFVVEMEDDGRAFLRFGDGVLGEKPKAGAGLKATYRVGNGTSGNVGAEAIGHIVTANDGVTAVRNPMPAKGGTTPESSEEVRLYAPQAFRTQKRAVTTDDYATTAEKHPEVQKAMATLRWTGSWHTMFITVDRISGKEVDDAFEVELCTFLDQFRLAGHDVEIEPPIFVPLDIIMTVCVKPEYFRDKVKQALLEAFSNFESSSGKRGFFHPDNFTFGQPVYLSQIICTTMQVEGVRWVDLSGKYDRFQRWGKQPNKELEAGLINMERLEIARLDNDPNAPENGKIEFIMEGGL